MFEFVKQVAGVLRGACMERAALQELHLLSDHHLADLGLRREQLASLAKPAPRERAQRPAPAFRPELVPCG
jgi:uncharacterized protein YjiS (DUF1127 family)